MVSYKTFKNGLRLVVNKMDGLLSVSVGVLVRTGSINETEDDNGISHFIEHVMFKGTEKRTAFDISDNIDRIGAQINAFTSKELTCYYTKSTKDHVEESIEILSDIFFNSTFKKEELEREKGVVIEEIKMSEDTPEDVCLDLLAKSYYGEEGLGRTILGPEKNIKRFNQNSIRDYMDKYYTADNVVISVAGNVEIDKIEDVVKEYFADKFSNKNSAKQFVQKGDTPMQLYRSKKIEQTHIGFAMKGLKSSDALSDSFAIANVVFGGGMSSRLFQKIREELGLAYSVYSYPSAYKDTGVLEIYAGVNTDYRDKAAKAIVEETKKFREFGVTETEFLRAKEQVISSLVFGQESTASQMLLYGKYLIILNEKFDIEKRLTDLENIALGDVQKAIQKSFDIENSATATVGVKRTPIRI